MPKRDSKRAGPVTTRRVKADARKRSVPKASSKRKAAKKVARARRHTAAAEVERARRPDTGPLSLVHDRDREVRFATFGRLTSEAREALVQRGLPPRFLSEALDALGVTRGELLDSLGIASSTAARLAQQKRPFPPTDSERLALLARLWDQVLMVYEDEAGARAWLTGIVPSAGGIPLRMLKTHEGFERAQRAILQLAYGVYA